MADNTVLNTGSGGDTIATDDIGGVKYPRSKITIGADGTNDGDVSSANPLPITESPATSGGLSITKLISAATTNATSVKASAGQLYAVEAFSTSNTATYLKLFNSSSAPPVGTDTPVKVLTIPGNTRGAGLVINWDKGLAFSSGIAFGLTTGVADSDTGAVAANEIVVNLDYS